MSPNILKPDGTDVKHVAESYNLGFTLEGLATGETIISVTTAVIPPVGGGLTVSGSPVTDGANISDLISGGAAGQEYRIRFTIRTSVHPVIIKDMVVKVIP